MGHLPSTNRLCLALLRPQRDSSQIFVRRGIDYTLRFIDARVTTAEADQFDRAHGLNG